MKKVVYPRAHYKMATELGLEKGICIPSQRGNQDPPKTRRGGMERAGR